MINCLDCAYKEKSIELVFDAKFLSWVCPECHRMYGGDPSNKSYTDKPAAMAAMREDRLRGMHRSASTKAFVDRIFKDRF